jgi:hypothetical protein
MSVGPGLQEDLVKVVRLMHRSAVFAAVVGRPPYRRVMWCSLMSL